MAKSKRAVENLTISRLTFGDLMELAELNAVLEEKGKSSDKDKVELSEIMGMFQFLDRVIDGGIKEYDVEDYQAIMEQVNVAFEKKFQAIAGTDEKN